jgi:hypothetical protein
LTIEHRKKADKLIERFKREGLLKEEKISNILDEINIEE